MATAALNTQPLHPETQRLLDAQNWTDDAAVKPLFSAIAALLPVGETLRELSASRPSINRCCGDDIGGLTVVSEMTGRVNEWQNRLRPSGAVASIWEELDALRSRWISARLTVEGLRSDMRDDRWFDRKTELEDAAVTVDAAWAAFRRGEG
jgi:hypothetical protein